MSVERQAEGMVLKGSRPLAAMPLRYMVALVGGVLTGFACFCALYGTLYVTGHLPPPPLSNNFCADDKLVFLRDNPPVDPNFLVLGSSVAWRNVDSSVIERAMPGMRPLNGGFCGLQLNQSAFIADWMIDHFPSIEHVLLVVSPLDYTTCWGTGQVFDPVDAREFVFEGKPAWTFYLRYFDPISLARNVQLQMRSREWARRLGVDRTLTKYGDGPLDTDQNRGLFYGEMPAPDPRCFAALHQLATDLAAQGRTLMVVATPIHPGWKERYDPDGAFMERYWGGQVRALEGTGAVTWNADDAEILGSSAFTDAIHVRWSSAGILTEEILKRFTFGEG